MKKLLIVYYSWSCGNTERTAKALQSVAGGDLVRLDTAVPYYRQLQRCGRSGPARGERGL